jgi:hypothetical protein
MTAILVGPYGIFNLAGASPGLWQNEPIKNLAACGISRSGDRSLLVASGPMQRSLLTREELMAQPSL